MPQTLLITGYMPIKDICQSCSMCQQENYEAKNPRLCKKAQFPNEMLFQCGGGVAPPNTSAFTMDLAGNFKLRHESKTYLILFLNDN